MQLNAFQTFIFYYVSLSRSSIISEYSGLAQKKKKKTACFDVLEKQEEKSCKPVIFACPLVSVVLI